MVDENLPKGEELGDLLEEAPTSEALEALGGSIGHVINNGMVGIYGSAQLALLKDQDNELWQTVYESAKKIKDYVLQVNKYLGKASYDREQVDLTDIVKESVKQTEKIQVNSHYQENLWLVNADEVMIKQAIDDIYTNAVEAMPDGGNLQVKTENVILDGNQSKLEPGKYIKISITDDGKGMDDTTKIKRVVPGFTGQKFGNANGFGLSIAHGTIKSGHKGAIYVTTEPGKGTTFDIYLPAIEK
jgi:signal transduction histidine kinase